MYTARQIDTYTNRCTYTQIGKQRNIPAHTSDGKVHFSSSPQLTFPDPFRGMKPSSHSYCMTSLVRNRVWLAVSNLKRAILGGKSHVAKNEKTKMKKRIKTIKAQANLPTIYQNKNICLI